MPLFQKQSRWVYFLPAVHVCALLLSMIGHVIPSLQYLGIIWLSIMLVDLPVSALAYALAWGHGAIAAVWVVLVGTFWWYLVSAAVATLVGKIRGRPSVPTMQRS
jgi:riboflavin transporter FmnP